MLKLWVNMSESHRSYYMGQTSNASPEHELYKCYNYSSNSSYTPFYKCIADLLSTWDCATANATPDNYVIAV